MAIIDNLEAYWKLDAASGNESDSSGNARTLTAVNSPGTTTGKISWARAFVSASSQCFTATYSGVLGSNARSYATWFLTTSAGGVNTNSVLGHGSVGAGTQWVVNIESGAIWIRCGLGQTCTAGSGYNDGQWHHLVVTLPAGGDVGDITIYVDGVSLATTPSGSTTLNTASSGLYVGYTSSGGATTHFSGNLDEFGVWSRELTSGEVAQLYNSGNGLAYPFATGNAERRILRGVGRGVMRGAA